MVNVANLVKEAFAAILSGRKRTEWRYRKRQDSRIESIERGEQLVLLEIGSSRAIFARITAVMRFDYEDGRCKYAIRFTDPQPGAASVRKVQGWSRRQAL